MAVPQHAVGPVSQARHQHHHRHLLQCPQRHRRFRPNTNLLRTKVQTKTLIRGKQDRCRVDKFFFFPFFLKPIYFIFVWIFVNQLLCIHWILFTARTFRHGCKLFATFFFTLEQRLDKMGACLHISLSCLLLLVTQLSAQRVAPGWETRKDLTQLLFRYDDAYLRTAGGTCGL